IDAQLQQQVSSLLRIHQEQLSGNEIHNIAALILDTETGHVLAYNGNVIGAGAVHDEWVDVIPAPRSTGSILKPFLYAFALQEGLITPQRLLSDVPMRLSGYQPENYHEDFDGVVTAERALVRSLNVPIVQLLSAYGLEKFHYRLEQLGMSTLTYGPGHYGLPLVLGGAEASLWELTGIYASMARMLNHTYDYDGQYAPNDFRPPSYLPLQLPQPLLQPTPQPMSAGAAWLTFQAMQKLERPASEGGWKVFESSRQIAWKTGTSFGFRDAWAIGVTPGFAVGIWVGNADGEGRPGLVGVKAAAPILFDLFKLLPTTEQWFVPPYDDLKHAVVCRKSGYQAKPVCPKDTVFIPFTATGLSPCPFHEIIHLDSTQAYQANTECYPPESLIAKPWFTLPPTEAHYYIRRNPAYLPLPAFAPGCGNSGDVPMELIYPKYPTHILVPRDLDGSRSRTVFTIAHRDPTTNVYWHLDESYLGMTSNFHSMELDPPPGKHTLTLVDEQGHRLEQHFEILLKEGD
ncbi:MAG: hypothetical protein KI786_02980, partial [Mameliella sp.]|nr:hypothetical protein [Phaeodactylibacter sp.]